MRVLELVVIVGVVIVGVAVYRKCLSKRTRLWSSCVVDLVLLELGC